MKVHGRCHCGTISYEADVDPARVSDLPLHRLPGVLTGSPYRVSLPPSRAKPFKLLTGRAPRSTSRRRTSGNKRAQAFCPECGAPVYSSAAVDPPQYSLRVGCLDERAQLPPRKQIWCTSAMAWAMDVSELPKTERQ